ncbi:Sodium/hydrogen exchanger family-domain-containing protein [Jimgerdemannia flammicorona]|uniref:Sodium/hydrogen exchanger family-domain-containing protein n=1 Tax=Jimgerdemannia flammicorona TaxID=994334 RepID=A0A433Q9X4_9FUNG|nr:Sodium/hydrogen exchanger family-domain-containing protein [Jimgerdemannia flammicorona]
MSAVPLGEISPFTVAIAVLSGFIILFGYVSMFIKERLLISEAFVAVVVGIIAGPLCANVIDPFQWNNMDLFTKELTRVTIAIQVLAVGISLPRRYMWHESRSMFMLLIPVMAYMWIVSALTIWWIVPPLNLVESLAIAACITPTDPILANSVVKGRFAEKHVPTHVQNVLSAESGANDGMGFPFLYIALFFLREPDSPGGNIGRWFYLTWLYQILLSCVIGAVVGYLARKVLQLSEQRKLIDKPSFLVFAIALALLLMSLVGMTGSDDLLACFVAGNAVSWDDWFRRETEEAHIQEVIDMLLNLSVFVYIGTIVPWHSFDDPLLGLTPWRLVVMALIILLVRRLPIVVILKPFIPAMQTYREAAFSGWFGPIGVGAVFLSIVAQEELHSYSNHHLVESFQPIVLFIVLSSVLVHGTTIPLFKLGKRIKSRTLSITSQNNQVSRLPRLQFGQQIVLRRPNNEGGDASPMDSRTTTMRDIDDDVAEYDMGIMNYRELPVHSSRPIAAGSIAASQPEVAIEISQDYFDSTSGDDGADEDRIVPMGSNFVRNGGDSSVSSSRNPTRLSTPSTSTPALVASPAELSSTPSNTIRIVEEPNPRAAAIATAISARLERERVREREQTERNEESVASLKSFLAKGVAARTLKKSMVEGNIRGEGDNAEMEEASNMEGNELSSRSLKGLFRSAKGSKVPSSAEGTLSGYYDAGTPRSVKDVFAGSSPTTTTTAGESAEVYKEGDKMVVEGPAGTGSDTNVYLAVQEGRSGGTSQSSLAENKG